MIVYNHPIIKRDSMIACKDMFIFSMDDGRCSIIYHPEKRVCTERKISTNHIQRARMCSDISKKSIS